MRHTPNERAGKPRLGAMVTATIVMCSLALPARAQWTKVATNVLGSYNVGYGGATANRDGILWAGLHQLFRSNDTGQTWTAVFGGGGTITAIAFYSKDTGAVAVYASGVYITNDGGNNWSHVLTRSDCLGVSFARNGRELFVADRDNLRGRVSYTSDAGTTWSTQTVENSGGGAYDAAYNPNSKRAYVLSRSTSPAYKSHINLSLDFGATWSQQSGQVDLDSYSFALDSCAVDQVYITNEQFNETENGFSEVYASADNGQTWRSTIQQPTSFFSSSCASSGNAIFAGSTSNQGVFRSTDRGQTWISIGGPSQHADSRLVTAINDNVVIAFDNSGNAWRTTNSGGYAVGVPLSISQSPSHRITDCQQDSVTIVIRNLGCGSIDLTSAGIGGPDASNFSLGPNGLPRTLAGSEADTIRVKFDPRHRAGLFNGDVTVVWSDGRSLMDSTIPITENILPSTPNVMSSPSILALGSETLCDPPRDTLVTLTNPGCDTVRIISGPDGLGAGFSADPLKLPIILPPDSSIQVRIHFHPLRTGNYVTGASFTADHLGTRQTINLQLFAGATATNGRSTVPMLVNFDTVSICGGLRDSIIALSNYGCDTIVITRGPILVGNGFTADTLTLPVVIPPDSTVFVHLHFQPSNTGNYATSALFTLVRDSLSEDVTVILQGKGVRGGGTLVPQSSQVNFGAVSLCDPMRDTVIWIRNQSCDTIVINSGSLSLGAGFTVDPIAYPIVLPPDSLYAVRIHFRPSAASSYSMNATFFATDHGANLQTRFSASGSAFSAGSGPVIEQTAYSFESITTCDPARDTTLTFTNHGCDTLYILNGPGPLGDGFTFENVTFPIAIPPDSSMKVHFRFRAPTVGHFTTSPHFDTRLGKQPGAVDLQLSGDETPGAAILSLATPSIDFAPLSICTNDSAEIVYTNVGCDTLFITPEGLTGDPDFSASSAPEQRVAPGDTIRIGVRLKPQQHGPRQSSYRLSVRSAYTQPVDTTVLMRATVTPGETLLSSSLSSVNFETTTICTSPDTTIILKNRGCDVLQIDSATISQAGFQLDGVSFPITVQPGDSVRLGVSAILDTLGGKQRSTSTLTVYSNSNVPLPPIDLIRSYRYRQPYDIRAVLRTSRATVRDTVVLDIIMNVLPQGLTTIDAQLRTGDTDLFTFVRSESKNAVSRTDSTIRIAGDPLVNPGGVLATLYYTIFLTTDSVADIRFGNVRFDSTDQDYERCIAFATSSGDIFNYVYHCGQHTIQMLMDDGPLVHLGTIRPNPVSDALEVSVSAATETEARIDIFNVLGAPLAGMPVLLRPGMQTIPVDVKDLPSGSYLLRIVTPSGVADRSFLKLR